MRRSCTPRQLYFEHVSATAFQLHVPFWQWHKLCLLAFVLQSRRRGVTRVEQCVYQLQLSGICAYTTLVATAGLCTYGV